MSKMASLPVLWFVAVVIGGRPVGAQAPVERLTTSGLHLLSAVNTNDGDQSYDPEIYQVNTATERLEQRAKVELGGSGLQCIRADFPGRRIAILWPRLNPTRISVVNMDRPAECLNMTVDATELPASAWIGWRAGLRARTGDMSLTAAFWFEMAGFSRNWLALRFASDSGLATVAVSSEKETERHVNPAGAISRVRVQGDFGFEGQLGDSDAQFVTIRNRKLNIGLIDIGVPAPADVPDSALYWRLVAQDGSASVMYRNEKTVGGHGDRTPLLIFNSAGDRWQIITVPGSAPRVKMIDGWILGTAVSDSKGRVSPGLERRELQQRDAINPQRRSSRLPTEFVFRENGRYAPGVLFAIHVGSGRYYEIGTGQGDSELLLVWEDVAYYRVNDSLFAASLKNGRVGEAKLLVKEDAISDVHWAFWTRN